MWIINLGNHRHMKKINDKSKMLVHWLVIFFYALDCYLNILEKNPGFLVFSIGSKFSVEDLF